MWAPRLSSKPAWKCSFAAWVFLGGVANATWGSRADRERAALTDIENIVVKANDGAPIYVRQLGNVVTGPDFRRGALDKIGAEAVGGCVVMRFGENPLSVIERVKDKIAEIEPGLPSGVRLNAFYDRSTLIRETMTTLGTALWQELLITVIAVVLFLLHFRSSLVIALTLPLAVLFAFIGMQTLGVGSNIMSLAGIAIAIGTMVDMGIVMTENIYQHLTRSRAEYTSVTERPGETPAIIINSVKRRECIHRAAVEVGGAILTAVGTTVISFLPVFFLEGQSARLFTPLAWTKTFCLVGAVLMALVVVPPLASVMLRERRISRAWSAAVGVIVAVALGWGWAAVSVAAGSMSQMGRAVRQYLGLASPIDALLVGVIGFVLTWVVLRERTRAIEENPTARLVHGLYEPVLRWVLGHKLVFLSMPTAVVVWGLAIWLGWGVIASAAAAALRWVGVRIDQWSLAGWVHLGLGLVVGLVVLPLALDSIRLARRRSLGRGWAVWPRRVACLVVALLAAYGLHAVRFAQGRSAAIAAIAGLSPTDSIESSALAALTQGHAGIGQEFMPPLDEGDFLYMPSVLPAGSINTVMNVMQRQDVRFAQIDEVEMVVGKLGRIESPLDPAPVGMLETIITLKPRDEWPLIDDPVRPDRRRRRTMREIWERIQEAGRFPGVLPSVELQPIRTRIEMLSTGLNARIGLKIYGDSLEACEQLAVSIERILRDNLAGAQAVGAIRANGKPYFEFHIDREAVARYGGEGPGRTGCHRGGYRRQKPDHHL